MKQGSVDAEELFRLLSDEVTSVTSHELRSPLRGIASLVEWISEDLGADIPESVARNLDRVRKRVERMEQITDSLRQFAGAGRTSHECVEVRPAEVIGAAVQAADVGPGFQVDLSARARWFEGAREPLVEVLTHLIRNAVQHHDRVRGRVTILAEDDAQHCVFTVTDDGPGVPAHGVERMFGLFQKLGSDEGRGVGLAMARRLADAHGGKLEFVPSDERRGATFRLTWPLLPAAFPSA